MKGGDVYMEWSFVLGFILGSITFVFLRIPFGLTHKKTSGVLKIDISDEDGPYLFLELDENPGEFVGKKKVCFKVETRE